MGRRLGTQTHTHIYIHGTVWWGYGGEGEEAEEENWEEGGEEEKRVQAAQTCPLLSRSLVQSRAMGCRLWAVGCGL